MGVRRRLGDHVGLLAEPELRKVLYPVIAQCHLDTASQFSFRKFGIERQDDRSVLFIVELFAVDFAERVDEAGRAIEVERNFARGSLLPVHPHGAPYGRKVAWLAPLQGFFELVDVVTLLGNFTNK